jgi:hypothetical protein
MKLETLNIPAHIWHGMAIAAAKKEIRVQLMGVHVECEAGKYARLVATDGHLLATYKTDHFCSETIAATIPPELIKQLPKKGAPAVTLSKNDGDEWASIAIETGAGVMQGKAINVQFPDYRRVIPSASQIEPEQVPANFDSALLERLTKCASGCFDRKLRPLLYQRGADAALCYVDRYCEWLGVIMPVKYISDRDAVADRLREL